MKPCNSILFFFILVVTHITAQNSKITIGKATTNSLEKAKSAQIIATFPKNDTISDSWLIDGFIEYSRENVFNYLEVGAFLEIHKNTLLSKEQDVSQFGLNVKKIFEVKNSSWIWFNTTLNLKQSNDKVKDKETFQSVLATTVQLIGTPSNFWRLLRAEAPLINEQSKTSEIFNISHNHSFGFGHIGGEENILLFNGSLELNIYPLSTLFYRIRKERLENDANISAITSPSQQSTVRNTIEKEARRFANIFVLNGTIAGRELVSGKTDTDLDTFIKISGGLNYNFSDDTSIGIMYGWQKGANPYEGLSSQTFSSITATLKLSI